MDTLPPSVPPSFPSLLPSLLPSLRPSLLPSLLPSHLSDLHRLHPVCSQPLQADREHVQSGFDAELQGQAAR